MPYTEKMTSREGRAGRRECELEQWGGWVGRRVYTKAKWIYSTLTKTLVRLSENEIRDITKALEAGIPLDDKYRFALFDSNRELELVWDGKSHEVTKNLGVMVNLIRMVVRRSRVVVRDRCSKSMA
mgnify:CR=1 FL=1